MSNKNLKIPILIPETAQPGGTIYVHVAPSTTALNFLVATNFYENFLNMHQTEPTSLKECFVCGTRDFRDQGITMVEKMWPAFDFADKWVRCNKCDVITPTKRPPSMLLQCLYSYFYPSDPQINDEIIEPRIFKEFQLREKALKGNVLDIGGGDGALGKYCIDGYLNIDMHPDANFRINIDDVESLSLLDNLEETANLIICCDLIEHLLKPRNIFELTKKCLNPQNGKLYLNVGQFHSDQEVADFHPPHIMSMSKKTIDFLCKDYDMKIEDQIGSSFVLSRN